MNFLERTIKYWQGLITAIRGVIRLFRMQTCITILRGLYWQTSAVFKQVCIGFSYVLLSVSLICWVLFDQDRGEFQWVHYFIFLPSLNLNLVFGVDGISIIFLLLTTITFPCCFLMCYDLPRGGLLMFYLVGMEILLIAAFSVLDLFFFCVFFEALVIPMVFIILEWGGKTRRILALTYFFMYTMLGSVFLITALLIYYAEFNTTSYAVLLQPELFNRMEIPKQRLFWICLFITFAIKIPVFPFHIWLPEAHVEAPTVGSVILAGLLLKIGGYGIIRFLSVVEEPKIFFQPLVVVLCLLGLFTSSVMALEQQDIKRIIAYSSVAHMNFAILGFFTNTEYGAIGAMFLMVSHGVVSAALFLLIGVIYNRTGDRDVKAILSVVNGMPIFCTLLFLFLISNFSFPGTSNFVGEFLIFIGLATSAMDMVLVLALISTFFCLVYSMLCYNRLAGGGQKMLVQMNVLQDLGRLEAYCLLPLLFLNFVLGIGPTPVLTAVYFNIKALYIPPSFEDIISEVYFNGIANDDPEQLMNAYCMALLETIPYETDAFEKGYEETVNRDDLWLRMCVLEMYGPRSNEEHENWVNSNPPELVRDVYKQWARSWDN